MNNKRMNDYGMYPQDPPGDEEKSTRIIRVLLSTIMVLLILAAAVGLIWMLRSPEETQPRIPEEAAAEAEPTEAERTVIEALGIDREQEPEVLEPPAEAIAEQPPAAPAPEVSADPLTVSWSTHTMAQGESLENAARSYGLDPRTLVAVNRITSHRDIRSGMELNVPDRDGQLYTIRSGDNLSVIARSFGMGYITLAQVNGIDINTIIYPGNELFIPRITMTETEYRRIMGTLVVRPAEGVITTGFGTRRDPITGSMTDHPGIEISNEMGTPVRSAMAGRVVRVDHDLTGFGRYVEIAHSDGYSSLYAHLDRIAVQQGSDVTQGQVIGEMGTSGKALEPILFFSLRINGRPVDPQDYL